METPVCTSCGRPKASVACGICQAPTCKKCVQRLEKGTFFLWEAHPTELDHKFYCGRCFDERVAPALASYQEIEARAKAVFVFDKRKSEETRLYRRSEKPLKVENCSDRQETLMKLAFLAARANFNALLDVEIVAAKVRNGGYQTTRWRGTGIPSRVDAQKLERE